MDGTFPHLPDPQQRPAKAVATGLPDLTRVRSKYSSFVRVMKLILPLVAGGLIALLIVFPQLKEHPAGFRLKSVKGSVEEVGGQRVVNPRYRGKDKRNQSFVITADEARQWLAEPDYVALKNPRASITLRSGAWVVLNAPKGRYGKKDSTLLLDGGITLFHDEGYDLHTQSAIVDLQKGTAQGFDPVSGKGPLGKMSSAGFQVLDEGHRIVFTGRSKLIVDGGSIKKNGDAAR